MVQTDSRTLRRAWLCLVLVPVGVIGAFVVGEVLPGLMGYGWVHGPMPLWPSILVGGIALILFCVPGILAAWFGLRASAAGQRIGLVPAAIGAFVAGYYVLLMMLSLFMGTLGG